LAAPVPPEDQFPVDAWTAPTYPTWFEGHRRSASELSEQRHRASRLAIRPRFSIVVPLFRTPLDYLSVMADSVLFQTYDDLELVLVNASPESDELRAAVDALRRRDRRVSVVTLDANHGITENTNRGIEASTGDFCCFLDHDDYIDPDLLFEYAEAINADSAIDVLYCDEDLVEQDGETGEFHHMNPLFKPQYSPELLFCKYYMMHLLTIRRELLNAMPTPDARFDGSQDFNMISWCAGHARHVHGVQRVMYHWRISANSTATNPDSKPYSLRSCRLAIQGQLERGGIDADIIGSGIFNLHDLWFRNVSGSVSAVVDCGDDPTMTRQFVETFCQSDAYTDVELVLVGCADARVAEGVRARIRLVEAPEGTRYARLNAGVAAATGDYLLFLDDRCLLMTPGPLEQLVGMCSLSGVGAVAPKVLFRGGVNKCYGVAVTRQRIMPLYRGYDDDFPGYECNIRAFQDVSALGLQGLLTSRTSFDEVGGFDESFSDETGAAEYCVRLRERGLRMVAMCTVKLEVAETIDLGRRYDNHSNAPDYSQEGLALFDERHPGLRALGDPFFNRNLDQGSSYLQVP
jgi:glycosyltransferase involved in cell wall biosynthesis